MSLTQGRSNQAHHQGQPGTASEYSEVIECLQKSYDRPCCCIRCKYGGKVEAPAVKNGNGKELWHLHDLCTQHLQALKVMKCKPSGTFITSLIDIVADCDSNWMYFTMGRMHNNRIHFMYIYM